MKVIKGFFSTIVLFIAFSIVMAVVGAALAGEPISAMFSVPGAISTLVIGGLNFPFGTAISVAIVEAYEGSVTLITSTNTILFILIPAGVAAIVGSVIERKSGSSGSIFAATFLGLIVCLVLGIIIAIPDTITEIAAIGIAAELTMLVSTIILGILNAAFWSSIGLIITSKNWA
jgi:hypothetical protein